MMTSWRAQRPADGEFAPFYTGYVAKVPDGDILETLTAQRDTAIATLRAIPDAKLHYRYAPDKWTVMQTLRHVFDAEWVFTYRALWIARGDQAMLPDMDQAIFVTNTDLTGARLSDWIEEFRHLRTANISLYGGFSDEVLSRAGTASGKPTTVRALLWVTAGHLTHHLDILRDRYL
jgi:uncharacterized damage-inducible protein DinB